jgi:hypothetical protein
VGTEYYFLSPFLSVLSFLSTLLVSNELFLPLIAVDSETEDIPSESEGNQWSAEALLRKNEEKTRYISMIKTPVSKACEEIIKALSK